LSLAWSASSSDTDGERTPQVAADRTYQRPHQHTPLANLLSNQVAMVFMAQRRTRARLAVLDDDHLPRNSNEVISARRRGGRDPWQPRRTTHDHGHSRATWNGL
jgi:hypothetical protein